MFVLLPRVCLGGKYSKYPFVLCNFALLLKGFNVLSSSYIQSTTNSCSQNAITSSATCGMEWENHCRRASCPSRVVAACASSGILWTRSLRTLRACSGRGLLEQYGSKLITGFDRGIEAAANRLMKSCFWNEEIVAWRLARVVSGIIGISKLQRLSKSIDVPIALLYTILLHLQLHKCCCTIAVWWILLKQEDDANVPASSLVVESFNASNCIRGRLHIMTR